MIEKSTIKNSDIMNMRERLQGLILKEGVTEKVIKLSQELDKIIVEIQKRRLEQLNIKTGS